MGLATVLAGVTLLGSGVLLAVVTPEDGPWIGSWLDDLFANQQALGGGLVGLGVVCFLIGRMVGDDIAPSSFRGPAVSEEEMQRALAQRMFNPPHPPKPDWGQTLRGLGLFGAVSAGVWYLGGAPAIDDFRLTWLRHGLDSYGSSILILGGTLLVWGVLTTGFAWRNPWNKALLEVPLNGAWWLLRQCALVLGALLLALVTGLGVSAFGT